MSTLDELDPVFAAARAGQADADASAIERMVRARMFACTGQRIGRYEIGGLLGRGGLGTVLRGYDRQLDREVAIKLVHAEHGTRSPGARQRLLREARALAGVVHPNVLEIFDVGEHGDDVYLVSELVHGETLFEWMARRPSVTQVVDVLAAAGRGLAAAHAAGLVHRDFKPANVIVAADGRVKVIDFGLAKAVLEPTTPDAAEPRGPGATQTDTDAVTGHGLRVGTPRYMPPEQMEGMDVDARADVFAFCVTMYEALTGELPFDDAGVRRREANAPDSVRARVLPVLARGLQLDPRARWPSMLPLVDALLRARRGSARWQRIVPTVVVVLGVVTAVTLARGAGRPPPVLERPEPQIAAPRPAVAQHVDDDRLRAELARIRDRLDAGDVETASADARALAEVTGGFASPSVRVEAILLDARGRYAGGEVADASTRAEEAYWIANAAADDPSAVVAAAEVMWLHATAGDGHAADVWREHATTALRRAPEARAAELRFCSLAAQVLERRGQVAEALELAHRRLELAIALHGESHAQSSRARAALGFVLGRSGAREGITLGEMALAEISQLLGPVHPTTIDVRVDLGGTLQALGEHARAAEVLQGALVHAEAIGPRGRRVLIGAINNLGLAMFTQGRDREADALFARAEHVLERSATPDRTLALVLGNRARVQLSLGAYEQAELSLARAMDLSVARGEAETAAYATTLEIGGMLELQREHPEQAQQRFDAAVAIRSDIGDLAPLLRAQIFRARAQTDRGRWAEARASVEATMTVGLAHGIAPLADAYVILGDIARARGDDEGALAGYRAATRAWQHEPADDDVIADVEQVIAQLEGVERNRAVARARE